MVITIAEDLAEDIPASDPRWEQLFEESTAHKHALGSSSSLQIITQLKEKNLALRHFVEFLHATGLWDKVSKGYNFKTRPHHHNFSHDSTSVTLGLL